VLGGSFSVNDIEVFPLMVYQAVNGELFSQLSAE
jgi:hypothetical protein